MFDCMRPLTTKLLSLPNSIIWKMILWSIEFVTLNEIFHRTLLFLANDVSSSYLFNTIVQIQFNYIKKRCMYCMYLYIILYKLYIQYVFYFLDNSKVLWTQHQDFAKNHFQSWKLHIQYISFFTHIYFLYISFILTKSKT